MKRKPEGWNIVLAGLWNRAIFTPEWVGRFLFPKPDLEILLSIMPYLPLVYQGEEVAMEISTHRLVFRPRQLSEACIKAVEEMALKVLDKLQDTPLLAVGVNFAFVEANPAEYLVRLFKMADDGRLGEAGWELQERRITRQVKHEDDILNLTLLFDGEIVTVEFNFHTETADNQVAQSAVKGRAIRLRDTAVELLGSLYRARVEEQEME